MSSDAKSILGTIYKPTNPADTVFHTAARHRPVAGRQHPTGEKGWGNSGPVTRASLHSSPATLDMRLSVIREGWMLSFKDSTAVTGHWKFVWLKTVFSAECLSSFQCFWRMVEGGVCNHLLYSVLGSILLCFHLDRDSWFSSPEVEVVDSLPCLLPTLAHHEIIWWII